MSNNFTKRLLLCVIGIPLLAFLILLLPQYNYIGLSILTILLAAQGSFEMSRMVFKKTDSVVYLAWTLPCIQYIQLVKGVDIDFTTFVFLVYIVIVLAREIGIRGWENNFEQSIVNSSKSLLVLTYPSFFLTFLIRMFALQSINTYSILLFFVLVFSNDIFAYVFGMLFGKGHGNVVKVSPKKSMAGFIGGTFSCIAICLLYFVLFKEKLPDFYPVYCALMALTVSMASNVGDLIESVFKRSAGVKDSSNIVPGRGGILDCIDSILTAAPVFFIFFNSVK